MEMFHPAPILPSNAPPWTGDSNDGSSHLHRSSDQTHNRQLGFLPSQRCTTAYTTDSSDDDDDDDDDDNGSADVLDMAAGRKGSMYSQPQVSTYGYPRLADQDVYTPVTDEKHDSHSNPTHHRRCAWSGEVKETRSQEKVGRDARRLAGMLSQCEGYLKYRSRQPKEGRGKQDQKWPDHMEDAFLRGTYDEVLLRHIC